MKDSGQWRGNRVEEVRELSEWTGIGLVRLFVQGEYSLIGRMVSFRLNLVDVYRERMNGEIIRG